MSQSDPTRTPTDDPTGDPNRTEGLDPGAFVGQRPERQASTIPGGIDAADERIAAHSTQTDMPQVSGAPTQRDAGQDR